MPATKEELKEMVASITTLTDEHDTLCLNIYESNLVDSVKTDLYGKLTTTYIKELKRLRVNLSMLKRL